MNFLNASSVISILMAIAMVFSSIAGTAIPAGSEEPVSVEITANVDADASLFMGAVQGSEEEVAASAGIVNALLQDVIPGLKIKVAMTRDLQNLAITAQDAPLITVAAQKDEAGNFNMLSNLLPTSVLTLDGAMVQAMGSMMIPGMEGLAGSELVVDAEKAGQVIGEKMTAFMAELADLPGETEAGSFEVQGVTYAYKKVLQAETRELADLFLKYVKEAAEDEQIAPVLAMTGFDASKVDEAAQNIANTTDEEMPETQVILYAADDGKTCTSFVLSQNDGTIALDLATDGNYGVLYFDVNAPESTTAAGFLTMNAETLEYSLLATMESAGTPVAVALSVMPTENGATQLDVAVNMTPAGAEKDMTVELKILSGHDAPEFTPAEDATWYDSETVMDVMSGGEPNEALDQDIMMGLIGAFTTLSQVLPAELMETLMPTSTVPAN